jgi:hypothetical protein
MPSAAIDIERKTARIFALTVIRCQALLPPIMVIATPEGKMLLLQTLFPAR